MNSIISITNAAATRIHSLITAKNNFNLKLRLYIVGGGCSGFQYGFSLEEEVNSDDMVITQEIEIQNKSHQEKSEKCSSTIEMVVDPLSLQYLENATVDYVEGLQGSRFMVQNPNAETTCGCGSSFSLKEDS